MNISTDFSINVEAAIIKDDKWLLCKRSIKEEHAAGVLSLIGGTIEHKDANKETLEAGLVREIQEEIGVKISVDSYVQSTSFVTERGDHVVDIVFICSILEGTPKVIDLDEIESLHWMTSSEIKNHENAPTWLVSSIERADHVLNNKKLKS